MIVGGVLTGQSLISAAEVRAQITQIEKYNSAVNTFRGKFNAIPGDMTPTTAQQFSFLQGTSCNGTVIGARNGDGLLDGFTAPFNFLQGMGETALFWQDLSSAAAGSLIDGVFPNGGTPAAGCTGVTVALVGTGIATEFPGAKFGHGNFIYVYEANGVNWFGVSVITQTFSTGNMTSTPSISVIQAFSIDKKIDDGSPSSGNVLASYLSSVAVQNAPNTTTSGGTSSSCYDTTTGTYSITVNNGNGGNCALSFKFQ